MRPISENFEN